ncbi:cytochrome c oxidase subunit II [Desulfocurvus sp. DL9XJH121]
MTGQVFEAARLVDQAFLFILSIAVGILLLVTALMLFFVWRYHYTKNPVPTETPGNIWLELAWVVIPCVLVLFMFFAGWDSYKAMRSAPEGAMEIGVEGRMWSWAFTYPDGRRSKELVVPVDTPVLLKMTSVDVIHSFYVPAMRIKMDTVPGLTTTVWFKSDAAGEFDILCAEYCGLKHANMLAVLKVVGQEEYEAWARGATPGAARGVELLEANGCTACHSLDGSESVGPSFKGISGRGVTVLLPDGAKAERIVDESYLRLAILQPEAEVVEGFDPVMPPYEGALSDEDLKAMVGYLMRGDAAPAPPGRELAENEGCLSCHSTDGTVIAGPSFRGLAGSRRQVVADGKETDVVADDAYLARSIVDPGASVTKDFDPFMPPYDHLAPEQVQALVDWIKSLGDGG